MTAPRGSIILWGMLLALARKVSRKLQSTNTRIVLAESCTAGLAAATLSQVPGTSTWLCGSAVVYRENTKRSWLGVSGAELRQYGAVSEPVARSMALGALRKTPEALIAASITGHLGPDAPSELDGVVYIGLARRRGRGATLLGVWRHELRSPSRNRRQQEAVRLLLERILQDA